MATKKTKAPAGWERWAKAAGANGMSEAKFLEMQTDHREHARLEASKAITKAIARFGQQHDQSIAFRVGLSPGTVARYRDGHSGPRGPLLSTYMALVKNR